MSYRDVMVSSRSFYLFWAAGRWGTFWDWYFLWFGVLKPCLGRFVHFTALVCRRCEITHAWEQACARATLAWPTTHAYIALQGSGISEDTYCLPELVFLEVGWAPHALHEVEQELWKLSFGNQTTVVYRWYLWFCAFLIYSVLRMRVIASPFL